jgi:hypothetical protein
MVAPSEEGADGVILIAHLLLLHFTIPVHFLASFFGVVTPFTAASEKPDHPGRASAHAGDTSFSCTQHPSVVTDSMSSHPDEQARDPPDQGERQLIMDRQSRPGSSEAEPLAVATSRIDP